MNDAFPHPATFEVGGRLVPAAAVAAVLACHMTAARRDRIDAVVARRSYTITTVLEHVHDDGNVAAVLRTCEGFGFPSVHLIADPGLERKPPNRVTQGADKWLDIHRWDGPLTCLAQLRAQGYRIVVTAPGERSIDELPLSGRVAFVFGNERAGVSAAAASVADDAVALPMYGFARSFNVSVAAAMLLQHARRGLDTAGGVESSLSPDQQVTLRAVYAWRSVPAATALLARAMADGEFDTALTPT